MTMTDPDTAAAAHLWVIRVQDSDFDDWDGLTDWLAGDADRLAAYEAALDDDGWVADLYHDGRRSEPAAAPARSQFQPEHPPRARRYRYAIGGAIAAMLVAAISFTVTRDDSTRIATAPGEHRAVALADGSSVILNGGTRITIDPDTPRQIRLAGGEALFQIHHDARNPFVVLVGKTRLLDAGTVFNVVSDKGSLDVAVAEGSVIYEPGGTEIKLAAGDALSRTGAGARPVRRKANPQAIGSWQTGRLQYSDAPLNRVARDLGRNLGRQIHPAGGAGQLRFTGTLDVNGTADDVLARTGPLLGVTFSADGDSWRMTPANAAPPT